MLDTRLAALADGDMPTGLADMEARVLTGIAARNERRNALRMTGVAAVGALVVGFVSPALLSGNAAATPFDPIGDVAALAPSTLLMEPDQ